MYQLAKLRILEFCGLKKIKIIGFSKKGNPTKIVYFGSRKYGTEYDSLRYIGVLCLTDEGKEHLLVGFPKTNNHCLMPLEWCIIYHTFVQKLTVQAARI